MKRILVILILALTLLFTGCAYQKVDKVNTDTSSMFVVIERSGNWKVVYHKKTKVMYAVSSSQYNYGTFTLLVDAEGKPLLWEGN